MKKLLRTLFINLLILKLLADLTGSLTFSQGLKSYFLVALALLVFEHFLKPVLKLLLLPINLLTLGLFRWVINIAGFFLAVSLVSGFSVSPYYFPGYSGAGFIIPSLTMGLLASYVFLSLAFNLIYIFIAWLLKK